MSEVSVSFLDHFKEVQDPRIERKKLYPIDEMLLVTVCAVICGAEGWKDLELFGKQELEYLRNFLVFKNGISTDDTFRRFFRALDPEQFKNSVIN